MRSGSRARRSARATVAATMRDASAAAIAAARSCGDIHAGPRVVVVVGGGGCSACGSENRTLPALAADATGPSRSQLSTGRPPLLDASSAAAAAYGSYGVRRRGRGGGCTGTRRALVAMRGAEGG